MVRGVSPLASEGVSRSGGTAPATCHRVVRLRIPILLSALGVLVALFIAAVLGPEGGTTVDNVPRAADFLSFWGGAKVLALWDPSRLYDHPFLWKVMQGSAPSNIKFQNLYPPPLYQAVRPLLPLGYHHAAQLHLVAMTAWSAGAFALLVRATPAGTLPRRWVWALLCVSPVVYSNLLTGQLGGVWLSILAGGVILLRSGRPVLGGAILGLLCIKPSLGAAVAAALLLGGQGSALLGFALGGALLLGGSLALDGVTPWRAWAGMMLGDRLGNLFPVPERQLTLSALLAFPFKGSELQTLAQRLGTGLGLAGALALSVRARIDPSDPRWPLRFGMTLSAMLLALPHMVDYDVGMHAVGLLASVGLLRGAARPRWGIAALAAVFFTPVLHWAYKPLHLAGGGLVLAAWLVWAAIEERAQQFARRPEAG